MVMIVVVVVVVVRVVQNGYKIYIASSLIRGMPLAGANSRGAPLPLPFTGY